MYLKLCVVEWCKKKIKISLAIYTTCALGPFSNIRIDI